MLNLVILCGGAGTRLWPLSKDDHPKQFLKLTDDNYTLFQLTCIRGKLLSPNKFIIICNQRHIQLVKYQLGELGISNYIILAEPFGRNTAPAIALSCQMCKETDNLLVLSSDHIWSDELFVDAINRGLNFIDKNIVIFGIKPTYPETGYGYINYSGNDLIKFVEKPNLDLAKKYYESGEYLWNSGIFLFNNKIMIDEFQKHSLQIWNSVHNTLEKSLYFDNVILIDDDEFKSVKDNSIDYAILENYKEGKVIEYNGLWNDIGSYNSLYDLSQKDKDGNAIKSNKCYTIDTSNCYISGLNKEKIIATIGIKDIIIIDTDSSLLVIDKSRCQDVKLILKKLKN
jgi:mannose-1-phosphate guanylyltransferase/mannose-6-phosphate isomerase